MRAIIARKVDHNFIITLRQCQMLAFAAEHIRTCIWGFSVLRSLFRAPISTFGKQMYLLVGESPYGLSLSLSLSGRGP